MANDQHLELCSTWSTHIRLVQVHLVGELISHLVQGSSWPVPKPVQHTPTVEHNKHTSDTTRITSESETQRAKRNIYHQSYNRIVRNASRTSEFIFVIQDYHVLKATKDRVFQVKVDLLSKDEHIQQLHVSIQPPYISFLLCTVGKIPCRRVV